MPIFRWWQKIKPILEQLYWTACARNSQSLNFLVFLPPNLTQKNCLFGNILNSHFSTTVPKLTCQNKNVLKNHQNLGRKITIVISYKCHYKSYLASQTLSTTTIPISLPHPQPQPLPQPHPLPHPQPCPLPNSHLLKCTYMEDCNGKHSGQK